MLLDLVLPQRCVVCALPRSQLCDGCRHAFRRLGPPYCERCGAPTEWPVRRCVDCANRRLAFTTARSAVVYDDRVRAFVSAWKERGLRRLAPLAAEIVDEVTTAAPHHVTFVPPDPDRVLLRGHHPAAALARELARRWEVPLLDLLSRTTGRRQRGLPLTERRANVRDVFTVKAASPRKILVLDDVYTSGSTVDAAARALRRAGAREVEVVTFARAVRGYYSDNRNLTTAQGGRVATSGEGQERRGHRIDPQVRRAEAREAGPEAG